MSNNLHPVGSPQNKPPGSSPDDSSGALEVVRPQERFLLSCLGCCRVVSLAPSLHDALKRFEPEPLTSFQAIWPQHNIVKVTVMPRLNNQDARGAIRLGGTFRVIHCEKVQGRQNT